MKTYLLTVFTGGDHGMTYNLGRNRDECYPLVESARILGRDWPTNEWECDAIGTFRAGNGDWAIITVALNI